MSKLVPDIFILHQMCRLCGLPCGLRKPHHFLHFKKSREKICPFLKMSIFFSKWAFFSSNQPIMRRFEKKLLILREKDPHFREKDRFCSHHFLQCIKWYFNLLVWVHKCRKSSLVGTYRPVSSYCYLLSGDQKYFKNEKKVIEKVACKGPFTHRLQRLHASKASLSCLNGIIGLPGVRCVRSNLCSNIALPYIYMGFCCAAM